VETAKRTGAQIAARFAAHDEEQYCVLRSPHVDKKSREAFEIRTHKRCSIFSSRRSRQSMPYETRPAGRVDVEIKAFARNINRCRSAPVRIPRRIQLADGAVGSAFLILEFYGRMGITVCRDREVTDCGARRIPYVQRWNDLVGCQRSKARAAASPQRRMQQIEREKQSRNAKSEDLNHSSPANSQEPSWERRRKWQESQEFWAKKSA